MIRPARQFTYEDRTPAVDRTRDVTFDNAVWGLAAQGSRSFGGESVRHRVTFGADWSRTTQEDIRDGTVPPMGGPFPALPLGAHTAEALRHSRPMRTGRRPMPTAPCWASGRLVPGSEPPPFLFPFTAAPGPAHREQLSRIAPLRTNPRAHKASRRRPCSSPAFDKW